MKNECNQHLVRAMVGTFLSDARFHSGYTLEYASALSGFSIAELRKFENGEVALEDMVKLLKIYSVPEDFIQFFLAGIVSVLS
jgi:hypothetical protein